MTATTVTEDQFVAAHGGPPIPIDRHGSILLLRDGATIVQDAYGRRFRDPPRGDREQLAARLRYARLRLRAAETALRDSRFCEGQGLGWKWNESDLGPVPPGCREPAHDPEARWAWFAAARDRLEHLIRLRQARVAELERTLGPNFDGYYVTDR